MFFGVKMPSHQCFIHNSVKSWSIHMVQIVFNIYYIQAFDGTLYFAINLTGHIQYRRCCGRWHRGSLKVPSEGPMLDRCFNDIIMFLNHPRTHIMIFSVPQWIFEEGRGDLICMGLGERGGTGFIFCHALCTIKKPFLTAFQHILFHEITCMHCSTTHQTGLGRKPHWVKGA